MVSLDAFKSAFDESKRPVFLVGNGLRLSHGGKGIKLIADFCEKNSIPIVSTYLAADFYPDSFPNYLGVTGLKAARRANIAIYNSDLVVVLGSRLPTLLLGLSIKIVSSARVFVVDIDQVEHSKKTRDSLELILADDSSFQTNFFICSFIYY